MEQNIGRDILLLLFFLVLTRNINRQFPVRMKHGVHALENITPALFLVKVRIHGLETILNTVYEILVFVPKRVENDTKHV